MTTPNDGDPAYYDTEFQSRYFKADLDILEAAIGGRNGVVSGCAVTQSAIPAMSVLVASGAAVFDGEAPIVIPSGTVLISNSNPTNPRFDLIVAVDDGSVDVITGVADPAPELPSPVTPGTVGLESLFVPAGDTAITTNQLVRKRILVVPPLGASQWNTITPTANVDRTNTAALAADPSLAFVMAANTKYRIRGKFYFTMSAGSGQPQLKLGVGGPASPTFLFGKFTYCTSSVAPNTFGVGVAPNVAMFSGYNTTTSFGFSANNPAFGSLDYSNWVDFDCLVHNGSNTSSFALWWSQVTATSANTIRRLAGSWLEYETV